MQSRRLAQQQPPVGQLSPMTIWSLTGFLPRYLIPMNPTVRRMVINAQEALAARKLAFPAFTRSSWFSSHHDSYQTKLPSKKAARIASNHLRPRLCLKTRSGFERLIFRLTASGCIDDKTDIACFAVFAKRKTARSLADDGVFRQSLYIFQPFCSTNHTTLAGLFKQSFSNGPACRVVQLTSKLKSGFMRA